MFFTKQTATFFFILLIYCWHRERSNLGVCAFDATLSLKHCISTRLAKLLIPWLFSVWLLCSVWYAQGPSLLSQMADFDLFWWLSTLAKCIRTTSSSNHLSKDTWAVAMCWPLWIMLQLNNGASVFVSKCFYMFLLDTQKRNCQVMW